MKTILWNVDTQKDFMNSDGALYVPDAERIKEKLCEIKKTGHVYGVQTVNTGDWHNEDSQELSDTPDYVNTFPPHCIAGTPGADFIVETTPYLSSRAETPGPTVFYWSEEPTAQQILDARWNNVVIYKDEFDVFTGNPHTDMVLEAISPDRVIVYGVATNVCVDFAVRGLLERDIEVYVVSDAIKELPGIPTPEQSWYDAGARRTTVDDLEELLKR